MAGKTPKTNHKKILQIQPTTVSNGFHVYYEAKSSQIAVPMASTRCQPSLERVLGWFLEK